MVRTGESTQARPDLTTHEYSRRLFLAHLAAMASGCAASGPGRSGASTNAPSTAQSAADARIAGLTLTTSQPLAAMRAFYADAIGLAVPRETKRAVTFATGDGALTFEHAPDVDAHYHFAFNIPENQIRQAYEFQAARGGDFILPPERLNDPGDPRPIVAFRHWNAHSVFFRDPAGNAVEYIARHDLDNARASAFSADHVLSISEIGLIVDDVPAAAASLREQLRIPTYVGASPEFEPIGDPNGLLLLMKRGRPMAFGQGRPRDVYPTGVRLRREDVERADVSPYPYSIRGADASA
jgi:extradiol dioxygenase family protein